VNKALGQAQMSGVANIQAATRNLFMKLGMTNSAWGGSVYGTGATTTLHDMGKLFTMMIHGGVYNKERLLSEEWVYKMTHPALEDANTSYGEFMWLNHRGNAAGIGGDIGSGSNTRDGDPCSPAAFWNKYPHEVSKAPDCHKTVATASCEQKYDIGNFSCQGLGGQFAIGHPGLDLVLTVKNFSGQNGPMGFWDKIRPAIVALDPMYKGDNDAFCKAYGAGDYAPDLKVQIQQPPDPMP
jgi:CubicO group peptidase (beta-lactamase class C family)